VWYRRLELDRALAEGTHPWRSPELAMRAAELTSSRSRLDFAETLERLVDCAEVERLGVTVRRSGIIECADDVRELVRALRSGASWRPHGAALASFLITNGSSPLYNAYALTSTRSLVRAALAAFDS
jgi:hypothetical protein